MKLKEIGEFGFIKKISRGCLIRPDNIIKAIGDDAAAFMTESEILHFMGTHRDFRHGNSLENMEQFLKKITA